VSVKGFNKTYFLLVIALLFIASASSSFLMMNKSKNLLSWNERATGWALVQLVLLEQAYINTLLEYKRGEDVFDQLLIDYDLTWSAYNTIIEGTDDLAYVVKKQGLQQLEKNFKEFEAADPLVITLSKEQIDIILDNTYQSNAYAMDLLNYEFQEFSKQRHKRDFTLVNVNKITFISLLLLCCCGGLFLFVILQDRRRIFYMAYHDSLTKLNNRSALKEKITQLQCNKANFITLLIDIDGFKSVNDRYGHDIGDQLLIHLAQEMNKRCYSPCFIARLGGDEFAIISFDQSKLISFVEKLLSITQAPITIQQHDCDVGLSIGISFSNPEHDTWVDILKDADSAMYQAKLKGGNQYQIYDYI